MANGRAVVVGGGFVLAQDGDRFIASLCGWMGEVLLRRLLAAGGTDDLAPRFFAGAAELLNPPWSMANGNDLRLAGGLVSGRCG